MVAPFSTARPHGGKTGSWFHTSRWRIARLSSSHVTVRGSRRSRAEFHTGWRVCGLGAHLTRSPSSRPDASTAHISTYGEIAARLALRRIAGRLVASSRCTTTCGSACCSDCSCRSEISLRMPGAAATNLRSSRIDRRSPETPRSARCRRADFRRDDSASSLPRVCICATRGVGTGDWAGVSGGESGASSPAGGLGVSGLRCIEGSARSSSSSTSSSGGGFFGSTRSSPTSIESLGCRIRPADGLGARGLLTGREPRRFVGWTPALQPGIAL